MGKYTVKKIDGVWRVLTPSGKVVAVEHKTRVWANVVAQSFNQAQRDERTVVTLRGGKRVPPPASKILTFDKKELAYPGGLEIQVKGFQGDDGAQPTQVYMEYYEGKLRVHVWDGSDKNNPVSFVISKRAKNQKQ